MFAFSLDDLYKFTSKIVLGAVLSSIPVGVFCNPSGGVVKGGSVEIQSSGKIMTVAQQTEKALIEWDSFSIGKGEKILFSQPGSESISLNKVVGLEKSIIDGMLKADGNVYLINPQGLIVSKGATVSTKGFLATTMMIDDQDFLSGKNPLLLKGDSDQAIKNFGTIKAKEGNVFILAKEVMNKGTIKAENTAALMGGKEFYLFEEGQKAQIKLPSEGYVCNEGKIKAAQVFLEAAGGNAFSFAVSNKGTIEARGIKNIDGRIILQAHDHTVHNEGEIKAANCDQTGGVIYILGEKIEVTHQSIVDVSGKRGGGVLLVGGDYKGQNPAITNCKYLMVEKGAQFFANATGKGDGGKAIFWADRANQFAGTVNATGKGKGNKGGFVEVSSKGLWRYRGEVDVRCESGETGTLFFDPSDIYISNRPTENFTFAVLTGDEAILNVHDLERALEKANITLDTSLGKGSMGNVIFEGPLSSKGGYSLTVNANHDCIIDAPISMDGKLIIHSEHDLVFNHPVTLGKSSLGLDGYAKEKILVNSDITSSYEGKEKGLISLASYGGLRSKIVVDHAILKTVAANIEMTVPQGNNLEEGITIQNESSIASRGKGDNAGRIFVDGAIGKAHRFSSGLAGVMVDPSSSVSSVDGEIEIRGKNNYSDTDLANLFGVMANGKISSKGYGKITIEGETSAGNGSKGIFLYGADALILAAENEILLKGRSSSEKIDSISGVCLEAGAQIIGEKKAGIIIDGSALGNGSGVNQYGIELRDSSLFVDEGSLNLIGKNTTVQSYANAGIFVENSRITSTGEGDIVGSIVIDGTGSGSDQCSGVILSSMDKNKGIISSVDADVKISGRITANNESKRHNGIFSENYRIETLGQSKSAGSLDMIGVVLTDEEAVTNEMHRGVYLSNESILTTAEGSLNIKGDVFCVGNKFCGVEIRDSHLLTTGSNYASLSITGAASGKGSSEGHDQRGVLFTGKSADIFTQDGDITIYGAADGIQAIGVELSSKKEITSSGSGSIIIKGNTLSNDIHSQENSIGVFCQNEQMISVVSGDLSIAGTIDDQEGVGVRLKGQSQCLAKGSGTLILTGSVRGSDQHPVESSIGIQVSPGSKVTAISGDIFINGLVSNNHNNLGLEIIGTIGTKKMEGEIVFHADSIRFQNNYSLAKVQTHHQVKFEPVDDHIPITLGKGSFGELQIGKNELAAIDSAVKQVVIGNRLSGAHSIEVKEKKNLFSSPFNLVIYGQNFSMEKSMVLKAPSVALHLGQHESCFYRAEGFVKTDHFTIAGGSFDDTYILSNPKQKVTLLDGGSGVNTLIASDHDKKWMLKGTESGSVEKKIFSHIQHIIGGGGEDVFEVAEPYSSLPCIEGRGGRNIFISSKGENEWLITEDDGGSLATSIGGRFSFQKIQKIIGGGSVDRFSFKGSYKIKDGIDGCEGTNYLIASDENNLWNISKNNGGSLRVEGSEMPLVFENIQHVIGGRGDDSFVLNEGCFISGGIDGSDNGSNSLTGPNLNNLWEITGFNQGTILPEKATKNTSFSNIQILKGGDVEDLFFFDSAAQITGSINGGKGGTNLVKGPNLDTSWVVTGKDEGTILPFGARGPTVLKEIENYQGGSEKDHFVFKQAAYLSGLIDGGLGGNNSITGSDEKNLWVTGGDDSGGILVGGEAKNISSFKNIQNWIGGKGNDIFMISDAHCISGGIDGSDSGENLLYSPNLDNDWRIAGDNAGSITQEKASGVTHFRNIQILKGNDSEDVFTFEGPGQITGAIFGGKDGKNIVKGPDLNTSWVVSGNDVGTIFPSGASGITALLNVENYLGGSEKDQFYFEPITYLSGEIDGGVGTNNTVVGSDENNQWFTTGDDAGEILPGDGEKRTFFKNIQNWIGGKISDEFYFTDSHSISGLIDGSTSGDNVLAGPNLDNEWRIAGDNAGSITQDKASGVTNFKNIQILKGNDSEDVFTFKGPGQITGAIFGGKDGKNIVKGPDLNTSWVVTGNNQGTVLPSGAFGKTRLKDIENYLGGSEKDQFSFESAAYLSGVIDGRLGDNNTVTGSDKSNLWWTTGDNSGWILPGMEGDKTSFVNIQNWVGGKEGDIFKIDDAHNLSGVIDGGDVGEKAIVGPNLENYWKIVGKNEGILCSSKMKQGVHFKNIQTLLGNNSQDIFSFDGTGQITGAIIGGKDGKNVVKGPNLDTSWVVKGNNEGTILPSRASGKTLLKGIENYLGGSEKDQFYFEPTSYLSGEIDGGVGTNNTVVGSDENNQWFTTGDDAGEILPSDGEKRTFFKNIQNWIGGKARDVFSITDAHSISGLIDGSNSGDNILVGPNLDNEWKLAKVNTGTIIPENAKGETSFCNIQNLKGNDLEDVFTFEGAAQITGAVHGGKKGKNLVKGPNLNTNWIITGNDEGTILPSFSSGKTLLVNIENYQGGSEIDQFTFEPLSHLSGIIDGGQSISNSIVGSDENNQWFTTGDDAGEILSGNRENKTSFKSIQNWIGGKANDQFVISDVHSISGVIDGTVQGDNEIIGPKTFVTWTITGKDQGKVFSAVEKGYSRIENVQSWKAVVGNEFVFTPTGSLSKGVEGARDGLNTVIGSDLHNEWIVYCDNGGEILPEKASKATPIKNIQNWVGGKGTDRFTFISFAKIDGKIDGQSNQNTIIGPDGINLWAIDKDNAGSLYFTDSKILNRFENITGLQGGRVGDTFVFKGAYALTGDIGILGSNTQTKIIGPEVDSIWSISGDDRGTLLPEKAVGATVFAEISLLIGGKANDTFHFTGPFEISQGINGSEDGINTLIGSDTSNKWTISDDDSGYILPSGTQNKTVFKNIHKLCGGKKVDSFFLTGPFSISNGIYGVGKENTIQGTDHGNEWAITKDNGGWILPVGAQKKTVLFDVDKWVGGKKSDSFTFTGAYTISRGIFGRSGINSIYGPATDVKWHIIDDNTVKISSDGSKNNTLCREIHNLIGGMGNDTYIYKGAYHLKGDIGIDGGKRGENTIYGPLDVSTTFKIDERGKDRGTLLPMDAKGETNYRNISNLIGGSSADVIDYQNFSHPVEVDLNKQSATNVTGTIENISGIIAGRGKNVLVGKDGEDNTFFFVAKDQSKTTIKANPAKSSNTVKMLNDMDNHFSITKNGEGRINRVISFENVDTLIGGKGNDSFFFETSCNMRKVDGLSGKNTLASCPNMAVTFIPNVYEENSGLLTYESSCAPLQYENIHHIWGRSNHDAIDYSSCEEKVEVNLEKGFATGLNLKGERSLRSVKMIIGGLGENTLTGQEGVDNVFYLNSVECTQVEGLSAKEIGNALYLKDDHPHRLVVTGSDKGMTEDGVMCFSNIGNIIGSRCDDQYIFSDEGSLSGARGLEGNHGENTLIGANEMNSWTITENNGGIINPKKAARQTAFYDVHNLVGAVGADEFILAGDFSLAGSITGSGKGNVFYAHNDRNNKWHIEKENGGILSYSDGKTIKLTNIQRWVGGTKDDCFFIRGSSHLEDGIDGAEGNKNIIIGADLPVSWVIYKNNGGVHKSKNALIGTPFANIQEIYGGVSNNEFIFENSCYVEGGIYGGSGKNSITGPDDDNRWVVQQDNSGMLLPKLARGTKIENIQSWTGNQNHDEFVFEGPFCISGGLDGANEKSRVLAADSDNRWVVSGDDRGTLYQENRSTELTNIARFVGGKKSDFFEIKGSYSLIGWIDGNSNANNSLKGPVDSNCEWVINGDNKGKIIIDEGSAENYFASIQHLIGGEGKDSFSFEGSFEITQGIDGGAGKENMITGFEGVDSHWSLTEDRKGFIKSLESNKRVDFINIDYWVARAEYNIFHLEGGYQLTNIMGNKRGQENILYGPDVDNHWEVIGNARGNLTSDQATKSIGFSKISKIIGGEKNDAFSLLGAYSIVGGLDGNGGSNSISGPGIESHWFITGDNQGYIRCKSEKNTEMVFENIHQLVGGADKNRFFFEGAFSVDNGINGRDGKENAIHGPDNARWVVSADNGGSVTSKNKITRFDGIQNWIGGHGDNEFVFEGSYEVCGGVFGGSGNNIILGPNVGNVWELENDFSGLIKPNGAINETSFHNINHCKGGMGNDHFVLSDLLSASLDIDGGYGENTLTMQKGVTKWTITDDDAGFFTTKNSEQKQDFKNIQNIFAENGETHFTFDGPYQITGTEGIVGGGCCTISSCNSCNRWLVQEDNGGQLIPKGSKGPTRIQNISRWIGGRYDDDFVFAGNYRITNGIDGSDKGRNTLTGADIDNTWAIVDDLGGIIRYEKTEKGTYFKNIHLCKGGVAKDVFIVKESTEFGLRIDGGDKGENILIGPDRDVEWKITGNNRGKILSKDLLLEFSNIPNIVSGSCADRFVFDGNYQLSGDIGIDGGKGDNNFIFAPKGYDHEWTITADDGGSLFSLGSKGATKIQNIQKWFGADRDDRYCFKGPYQISKGLFPSEEGKNEVVGPDRSCHWFILEDDGGEIFPAGSKGSTSFSHVQSWVGGKVNDVFTFKGPYKITHGIDGGEKSGIVNGPSVNNQWYITKDNGGVLEPGLVNKPTVLSNITSFVGNNKRDEFSFIGCHYLSDGIVGNDGVSYVNGPDVNSRWEIHNRDMGYICPEKAEKATKISSVQNWKGGACRDEFVLMGPHVISGIIDGGLNMDNSLRSCDGENHWFKMKEHEGVLKHISTNAENSFKNIQIWEKGPADIELNH